MNELGVLDDWRGTVGINNNGNGEGNDDVEDDIGNMAHDGGK